MQNELVAEEYVLCQFIEPLKNLIKKYPLGKQKSRCKDCGGYTSIYPGYEEIITFSTFHWALYMVNNKCAHKTEGGQPYTCQDAKDLMSQTDKICQYIDMYMVDLLQSYKHIYYLPCKQPNSISYKTI